MDLIDYLQSYSNKKRLPRKRMKKIRRRDKIPRRGRGYGQRYSKYNNPRNENFNNNVDKALATILTAITKINSPLTNPERLTQGKEYIERDRQLYSQVGKGQREFFPSTAPQKALTSSVPEKAIEDPIQIKEQKALVYNTTQDFETKMKEILDKQEDLEVELGMIVDFGEGEEFGEKSGQPSNIPLSSEAARDFRRKNLELKEEVLSQSLKIQEVLNDAKDLNDYKDLVVLQNKLIGKATENFVQMDNEIDKENKKTFDELQKGLYEATESILEQYAEGQEKDALIQELEKRFSEVEVLEEERLELKEELEEQKEKVEMLETRDKLTQQLLEGTRKKAKDIVAQQDFERFGILGQEIRGNIQERLVAQEIDEITDQTERELIAETEAERKSGVLGVLGRDVLAGVRQRVDTKKQKKTKSKLQEAEETIKIQERDLEFQQEDIRSLRNLQGKMVTNLKDLRDIVKQQQTVGTLQGIREEALAGVRQRAPVREMVETSTRLRKRLLEESKRAERAEAEIEKQQEAITRGLGREIVGRKKQATTELGLITQITEANQGEIEAKRKHNTLLEKFNKAEQQKANAQAQLRGLKQYADSLNDQLLASGAQGTTAQVQFFNRRIKDLENDLEMEKRLVLDMELKLEKNEEREEQLRQKLKEVEDEVDRQAELELQRAVSGLSDI